MSKPIKTYEDLVEEQERLEGLLKLQKENIRSGMVSLKSELKPAFSAFSFLGSLVSRDYTNPILGTAANSVIDLVLKRIILGRAGWIARTIIPLVTKNMTSHYIADHENDIFRKIFKFFGFKKKKRAEQTAPIDKANGQVIID